jgi:hypothetical protein
LEEEEVEEEALVPRRSGRLTKRTNKSIVGNFHQRCAVQYENEQKKVLRNRQLKMEENNTATNGVCSKTMGGRMRVCLHVPQWAGPCVAFFLLVRSFVRARSLIFFPFFPPCSLLGNI